MFMAGPFIARLAKLLLAWLASLFLAMAGLVRWFVLSFRWFCARIARWLLARHARLVPAKLDGFWLDLLAGFWLGLLDGS